MATYLTAAAAGVFAARADATINYIDLDPDQVTGSFFGAYEVGYYGDDPNAIGYVDILGDSTPELLVFTSGFYNHAYTYYSYSVIRGDAPGQVTDALRVLDADTGSDRVSAFRAGDLIGPGAATRGSTLMSYAGVGDGNGSFDDSADPDLVYLGFRIDSDGVDDGNDADDFFGWARVRLEVEAFARAPRITIFDLAYEDQPGVGIIAGDTGSQPIPGDFDDNGIVDDADIDLLTANFGNPAFDLTSDSITDSDDLLFLVQDILGTEQGDANLDLNIDLIDLSSLASSFGQINTGWEQGDFNGDKEVNLIDLSLLATNFGFTATIPEPTSLAALALGLGAASQRRR
ncbi:PEP-CTERM sorting domain-containing protein [Mucisphaera sp.]|uniref:PEP-CTERM sorting domain-containing protein n=1 Tax=Mucisphaera sp. TaxID=2913024 RepID=UPI003D11936C